MTAPNDIERAVREILTEITLDENCLRLPCDLRLALATRKRPCPEKTIR